MSPVEEKILSSRATAVMLDARRKPECAQSARNWLNLAARHAERHGMSWLAADMRRFEQAILGN